MWSAPTDLPILSNASKWWPFVCICDTVTSVMKGKLAMPPIRTFTASTLPAIMSACFLLLPLSAAAEPPTVRFTDVNFTKNEFRNLNARQIHSLLTTEEYALAFTIEGFSRSGSSMVLVMASAQRGRTRRLLRDMCNLTSRADRQARLREEIQWVEDLKENINQSITRLRNRPDNVINRTIIENEEARLLNLQDYRRNLRRWLSHPSIGTS